MVMKKTGNLQSLFLAWGCNRVCFYLVKFELSTVNGCFGRLIKLILVLAIAMKWKNLWSNRNFHAENINFEIAGEDYSSKI